MVLNEHTGIKIHEVAASRVPRLQLWEYDRWLLWAVQTNIFVGLICANQLNTCTTVAAYTPATSHPPAKFLSNAFTATNLRFRTSIKLRLADSTVACALSTLR